MDSMIQATGKSDLGKLRDNNEDAFFVDGASGLIIVSDGMGGQQAGEVASLIVVEALPKQIAAGRVSGALESAEATAELLAQSIEILTEMVFEKSREITQLAGMGATVVVGQVVEQSFVLAHLGDSRAYLLRDGAFERLTEDHTMAEILLDAGAISKKTYRDHPGQHMLRRFVGMEDSLPPGVGILDLRPGDRILLCTDGLTGMVDDRTIGQLMLAEPDGDKACQRLIDLANEAGGKDNITVVIADVPSDDENAASVERVTVRRAVGKSLRRHGACENDANDGTDELILEDVSDD